MYEINFHTKISSAWFAGLSIVFLVFSVFWSIWEYEIKFHTKGFGRESTKFFAYENFFFYSMRLFLHYFTLERLRIFEVLNLKKKQKSEVTKTLEQSGLEPETIRSRIFSLFTSAICELTNAGGQNWWNCFGDRHRLSVPAVRLQAFATHRDKAFVTHFSSRETVVSKLFFLG